MRIFSRTRRVIVFFFFIFLDYDNNGRGREKKPERTAPIRETGGGYRRARTEKSRLIREESCKIRAYENIRDGDRSGDPIYFYGPARARENEKQTAEQRRRNRARRRRGRPAPRIARSNRRRPYVFLSFFTTFHLRTRGRGAQWRTDGWTAIYRFCDRMTRVNRARGLHALLPQTTAAAATVLCFVPKVRDSPVAYFRAGPVRLGRDDDRRPASHARCRDSCLRSVPQS